MTYTFLSNSRDYNDWTTEPMIMENFEPIEHKLFSNDTFEINNENVTILDSQTRDYKSHCGILILQGNKTFGKAAKGRLYYKCIPNDKTLPVFLIPYELRIGFSKNHMNKYVTFKFNNWEQKHPIGTLTESFGDVDNFSSFCSYQLWTKKLVYSISSLQKQVKSGLNNMDEKSLITHVLENDKYNVIDKRDVNVYSIDPENSRDLDDAFSIEQVNDDQYKMSIYIANVPIVLDCYDLWEHLTHRISTIYLPEERRTMLPEILSDNICSLLEDKERFAFTMEVLYDGNTKEILPNSISFYNSLICVKKNYVYEEKSLLKSRDYKQLYHITKQLDANTQDSHDVISYWMIYMNTQSAKLLYDRKCGLFRKIQVYEKHIQHNIDDKDIKQTVSMWNNISSGYVLYNENESVEHDLLNIDGYVQITSPIRRMVDIMNQYYFMSNILNISFHETSTAFICEKEAQIQKLNEDMKSIRKVQSECDLLYTCIHNEEFMNSIVEGYVFDKTETNGEFNYCVYMKSLKKITYFKHHSDIPNYSFQSFKLFLFDRENSGHRKIRLMLQD
jgi:exoribonuclease R